MKKIISILIIVAIVAIIAGIAHVYVFKDGNIIQNNTQVGKIDDWKLNMNFGESDSFLGNFQGGVSMGVTSDSVANSFSAESKNIGFSVGGAKDTVNFRENII